jgi:uncharacterized membrane protein YcgQ (UPF0703/DUF1980 family)
MKVNPIDKNRVKEVFRRLNDKESDSYANSLGIYGKLFLYYPMKYMLLFYIALIIYKILLLIYDFLYKAYKKFKRFGETMFACANMQKCGKKFKGHRCCELNLLLFSIPDVFKLLMAVLDFFIGFIFMVPFNLILPEYKALI